MAVDTVRLRSCYISEDLAVLIENESFQRIGIDMKTHTIAYTLTSGELTGSHDSRISIMVKRQEYRTQVLKGEDAVFNPRTKNKTVLVDSKPYIEIEASLHKLFLGHNIYGGTEDFQHACLYLFKTVEKLLQVRLPGYEKNDYEEKWIVKRIDFAYVFHLSEFEAVQEFFYLMKNSYYPRRSVKNYGLDGMGFNASTTVVKFYLKGTEFRKHDFSRLRRQKVFTDEQLFDLLTFASGILRVEIEIKSKKLKYDFKDTRYGHEPYIMDITPEYLQKTYETEIDRCMKEGKKKSDVVRDSLEVERILNSRYDHSKSNVLFSAYLKMVNFGIEKYKKSVPKSTYYRHLKELKEVGISVNLNTGSNTFEVTGSVEPLLPKDFQPLRDDPRRLIGIDESIIQAIENLKREKRQKKYFQNVGADIGSTQEVFHKLG